MTTDPILIEVELGRRVARALWRENVWWPDARRHLIQGPTFAALVTATWRRDEEDQ